MVTSCMIELPSLYPHQEKMRDEIREALGRLRRSILCAPPGTGKTRLAKWILGSYANRPKTDGQSGFCLFVVHRRGLVDNASNSFGEYPELPHGIIMSGRDTDFSNAVHVASIDTIKSWYCKGEEYEGHTFDLIVYDECHSHVPALRAFLGPHDAKREKENLKPAFVMGLSATPQHKELNQVFQSIVKGPTPQWLIDNHFLSPFRYFQCTKGDLSKLVKQGDDYTEASVAAAMTNLAGDLVKDWKRLAAGRATVGFFPRRSHAAEAVELLCAAGVRARYIDGETPDDERREMFADLNEGRIDYIANVGVIERGTDIPRIGCVQMCTAVGNRVRWCLDEDTQILTPSGWKGIDDSFSLVYQVDANLTCSVSEIIGRTERPVGDVPMFGISGRSLNIRVSKHHRMLIHPRRKPCMVVESQNMPLEFRIPVACFEESLGVPLSDSDIRFLGLVATDGSIDKSNNQIKLFQSDRHPECIEYIESVIHKCGFAYSKIRQKNTSCSPIIERHPRWVYSISLGNPRNSRLDMIGKTGWKRLHSWVSKNPAEMLNDCTRSQLLVLLEAMRVGDGDKYKSPSIDWNPRTFRLAVQNREYAESLQSLCIRRGVRCVLTDNGCGVNCLLIDTTRQWWSGVTSSSDGRDVWKELPPKGSEWMWCVEVPAGFLIARRQGKPFIVGNCQMIGRGSRIHSDVDDCIVLDHADGIRKHGFFEDDTEWSLEWGERPAKTNETRATVECPSCGAVYRGGQCRQCGYEPTKKERKAQGLEFVGGELQEVSRKDAKPKEKKTCEELMISALFAAARGNRTFSAACVLARKAAEKQGTQMRIPATVEIAGVRYRMIPYGNINSKLLVKDTYGALVGNYSAEANPYRER